jgi:hypothetical protein
VAWLQVMAGMRKTHRVRMLPLGRDLNMGLPERDSDVSYYSQKCPLVDVRYAPSGDCTLSTSVYSTLSIFFITSPFDFQLPFKSWSPSLSSLRVRNNILRAFHSVNNSPYCVRNFDLQFVQRCRCTLWLSHQVVWWVGASV